MKKRTIILITIFSLAAVGGGGYGIYHLVKNGGSPVEVTSVANLNQGYWGSETSSSGTITSKANQEVHLESNNVINQVYVKEGDKVKVGDKLLLRHDPSGAESGILPAGRKIHRTGDQGSRKGSEEAEEYHTGGG